MKIRFRDLSVSDSRERQSYLDAFDQVLRHGQFILGPEVNALEEHLAEVCGRRFGVGVSSGTDALYFALRALKIGPGDEVIVPSLSWIASANAIAMTGATPVFADIGEDLNLDVGSAESMITERTRAILPVHFTGALCDIEGVLSLARKHDLSVIEDAAQAFGARLANDKCAGNFGTIAAFSINPMKILPSFGEAGLVLCDEEALYDNLRALRYNGMSDNACQWVSLNGRIDTLQAAIILLRLEKVPEIVKRRQEIANFYRESLTNEISYPMLRNGDFHTYYSFQILTSKRDALKAHLLEHGIETQIQHSPLLPDHPAYRDHGRGDYPTARRLVKQILCLPNHEKLIDTELDYIVKTVNEFFG